MIKTVKLLIFLFIIVNNGIVAQSNYLSGFVITLQFDTIYGEIKNSNGYSNSQTCEFLDINKNKSIKYYPGQIYGYGFTNGKYYISKEINGQKLFLECLIEGNLNVFFHQDNKGNDHYYASKDSVPIRELKHYEVSNYNNGGTVNESKPYINILYYYTKDCPELRFEISQLAYLSRERLVSIAEKYHNITSIDKKCTIYESVESKTKSSHINGFIITSSLDSIYGEIQNNDYYSNSQVCEFKNINNNIVTKYTPDQIYGYRYVDGKYYISKDIGGKKLFLEYLINGKLNIYFYQDKDRVNHYFASNDSVPLRELKYKEEFKIEDGIRYAEYQPFVSSLQYYTRDCPELKQEISKIGIPSHRNLIGFAKKYHYKTCENEDCIIYGKSLNKKIKLSIYTGPNIFFKNLFDADSLVNHNVQPTLGLNFLFQQIEISEDLYLGLGLVGEGKIDQSNYIYRIPLSVNYLKDRSGFSPYFSYEIDLNTIAVTQAFNLGVKYKMNDVSLILLGSLKTAIVVIPYSAALRLGLVFDLK